MWCLQNWCARVDAIVVGADRIAANGDTANKVSPGFAYCYMHDVKHNSPFYSVDMQVQQHL
jgi:methylthioribose-1-phosphate isomerase